MKYILITILTSICSFKTALSQDVLVKHASRIGNESYISIIPYNAVRAASGWERIEGYDGEMASVKKKPKISLSDAISRAKKYAADKLNIQIDGEDSLWEITNVSIESLEGESEYRYILINFVARTSRPSDKSRIVDYVSIIVLFSGDVVPIDKN